MMTEFIYWIHRIFAPFNFKRTLEDFDTHEKIIAMLYFPALLIMWYGYYMWKLE